MGKNALHQYEFPGYCFRVWRSTDTTGFDMIYNLYEYTPSLRAAIAFAVAFSLTGIALVYLLIRDLT